MRAKLAGAALGLTVAAAVLAGCGSSSGNGSADAASSPAASSADTGGGQSQGTTVEVKATEFSFSLPQTTFAPGTYTFRMSNDGHATHAMEIEGPGVSDAASDTSGPGGTSTLTVTLKAGTYTLYCPVDGHRGAGMQTTLTVK